MNTYSGEVFPGYANIPFLLKILPAQFSIILGGILSATMIAEVVPGDFLVLSSDIYFLELFCKEDLSLLCHLFIFVSAQAHGYLFYPLG